MHKMNVGLTKYATSHHCRVALNLSEDVYFSAPTAKKNQSSTTIDTMTDNRPTQVDQDLLAINRQKTYTSTLYIHTGIRKGINGPHLLKL